MLAPVLLYALFLPGHSATGVRWTVYGTLPLIVPLLTGSPAVSGTSIAIFPDDDFHWFPLQTPGLVTIRRASCSDFWGERPRFRDTPHDGPRHRTRHPPARAGGGA